MNDSRVVVDASFLLKILLPEDKSEQAERLWRSWIENAVEITAPTLIVFETSSVIRNNLYRGIIDEKNADRLIIELKELDITLIYTEDMLEEAWEISKILNISVLYDCFYIALSKFLNIPLWTADVRLYNSAKRFFPQINLL